MASNAEGGQTAVKTNGCNGDSKAKPFLIGVGGGTASGKVCKCSARLSYEHSTQDEVEDH